MFVPKEITTPIYDQIHVIQSILEHSAWYGEIEGLRAEKLIRGKEPFTYLLRQGEASKDEVWNFYVTFILADGSVRHQPFVITLNPEGWYFENICSGGPFSYGGVDAVLHRIMHCGKGQLIAFNK